MLYILNYIYYFTYIKLHILLNRIESNRIESNHLNVSTLLSKTCIGVKNHLFSSCPMVSK